MRARADSRTRTCYGSSRRSSDASSRARRWSARRGPPAAPRRLLTLPRACWQSIGSSASIDAEPEPSEQIFERHAVIYQEVCVRSMRPLCARVLTSDGAARTAAVERFCVGPCVGEAGGRVRLCGADARALQLVLDSGRLGFLALMCECVFWFSAQLEWQGKGSKVRAAHGERSPQPG